MAMGQTSTRLNISKESVDIAIRIGILALLVYWCLLLFLPFLVPVLWAIIIAAATFPLYLRLESLLGNRRKLALTVFTLIALAILIIPSFMLARSLLDTVREISSGMEAGTLRVPPPPDSVAEWPLIGDELHGLWSQASENLVATAQQYAPQLKQAGKWFLSLAAGAGVGLVQFVIAILIAAVFIANAEGTVRFVKALAVRLAGQQAAEFAALAGATMRSVAQGVLGVAVIQSLLAGIGFLVVGVPGAGLWSLLVLLLAIVQLPALLVIGPIIVYVFSAADTVPAVLFMIWGIFVSVSDTFLKPMLLGRGVDVPMLVILIGAIGGMILSGIIGLFTGAVVLALGYKLFVVWLEEGLVEAEDNPTDGRIEASG